MYLSRQDIVDLVKLASTEVVSGLNDRALREQTAGVVDTVLNRAASGRWGKKGNIRSVINADRQFSKIAGPAALAPYGSVQNMPNNRINRKVEAAVLEHLQYRINGGESIVGNHLHYANPNRSDASNMSWVRPMALKARREGMVYGSGDAIHVHGTEPTFNRFRPSKFDVKLM